MKKRRSAALHAGEDGRRVVCEEGAGTYISTRAENRPGPLDNRSGHREVVALNFFLFLPPPLYLSTLWLTIFYITMTRPGLGTGSPAKALCDRKTCTKLKTTNLPRGFSSNQRSAATARILYGEHPLIQRYTFKRVLKSLQTNLFFFNFSTSTVCQTLNIAFLFLGVLENKDFNVKVSFLYTFLISTYRLTKIFSALPTCAASRG